MQLRRVYGTYWSRGRCAWSSTKLIFVSHYPTHSNMGKPYISRLMVTWVYPLLTVNKLNAWATQISSSEKHLSIMMLTSKPFSPCMTDSWGRQSAWNTDRLQCKFEESQWSFCRAPWIRTPKVMLTFADHFSWWACHQSGQSAGWRTTIVGATVTGCRENHLPPLHKVGESTAGDWCKQWTRWWPDAKRQTQLPSKGSV